MIVSDGIESKLASLKTEKFDTLGANLVDFIETYKTTLKDQLVNLSVDDVINKKVAVEVSSHYIAKVSVSSTPGGDTLYGDCTFSESSQSFSLVAEDYPKI